MPDSTNRQIRLIARPQGKARLGDFDLIQVPRPVPQAGQILLRNKLLSIDPYQRNLMGNNSSELPPIDLNTTMPGPTVAVVEESNNPAYRAGDHVQTWTGWQDYALSDGSDLRQLDVNAAPPSTALGVLGHTGLSAWMGVSHLMDEMQGGTFVVSAAAGSVGSMAAQIARLKGYRVVGIAGGPVKVAYLKDVLELDEAVDYKAPDFDTRLAAALPTGVDRFFDNVGDHIFEAVMPHLNTHAQVVICGTIAGYNETTLADRRDHLPLFLNLVLYRFVQVRGFNLLDHLHRFPEFLAEATPWVTSGQIKYNEQFVDSFERIPEAFLSLFDGGNSGKLIARNG